MRTQREHQAGAVDRGAAPEEWLDIALSVYAEPASPPAPTSRMLRGQTSWPKADSRRPSLMLVLDTETTVDTRQTLTFGSARLYERRNALWNCVLEYVFYADDLPEDKKDVLLDYFHSEWVTEIEHNKQTFRERLPVRAGMVDVPDSEVDRLRLMRNHDAGRSLTNPIVGRLRRTRYLGAEAQCWRCGETRPAALIKRRRQKVICYECDRKRAAERHHPRGRKAAPRDTITLSANDHRVIHSLYGEELVWGHWAPAQVAGRWEDSIGNSFYKPDPEVPFVVTYGDEPAQLPPDLATSYRQLRLQSEHLNEAGAPVKLLSLSQFLEVFYDLAFTARSQIVGFNLPFDLSRLARRPTVSRIDRSAFSLQLWSQRSRPWLTISKRGSKGHLIKFTKSGFPDEVDQIPEDGSGEPNQAYGFQGRFLDLSVLLFALYSRTFSLDSAGEHFQIRNRKMRGETHGEISRQYIEYNRRDVRATFEVAVEALKAYDRHPISSDHNPKPGFRSEVNVYSPAGMAKAYYRAMNVGPPLGK